VRLLVNGDDVGVGPVGYVAAALIRNVVFRLSGEEGYVYRLVSLVGIVNCFGFEKLYLRTLTVIIFTQDTLGWGSYTGPYPNIFCVSVIIVHNKYKYHFPLVYAYC
jgi:hypothetical protein